VIPADEPLALYRIGIGADLFKTQVAWLASRYRIVSLQEFLWWLETEKTPTTDLAVLTFDDGYTDNLTEAVPVLQSHGLTAAFYISAAGLDDAMPYWPEILGKALELTEAQTIAPDPAHEWNTGWAIRTRQERARACLQMIARIRKLPAARIAEAMESTLEALGVERERALAASPRVLADHQVRTLAAAGFTIGSHTVSHPYLPAEDEDRQRSEIVESRRRLEQVVGGPVLDFCYPGGGYTAVTRRLVSAAGYRSATTTDAGVAGAGDDPFLLPRLGIGQALASNPIGRFSPVLLETEISGLFTAARRRLQAPPVRA
jgi:peptidoglycan/xylan/chitin deacetylase (PgdA/CDA1 family)